MTSSITTRRTLIATALTTHAGLRALETYLRLERNKVLVSRTAWTFYHDASGELIARAPSIEAVMARHRATLEI